MKTPEKILVTGGAGYIGSHTVVELVESGFDPVIVDNFSNSRREVLGRIEQIVDREIECHEADVVDAAAMDRILSEVKPVGVIHFAALKAVGESVERPVDYYRNNLGSTLTLVTAMQKHGIKRLIFSSSATVYGKPAKLPIKESAPLAPTNPYGWTKAMSEQILRDVVAAGEGWQVALLRYFNPVGAHESGLIGEDPQGVPNNLMPYVAQVASGKRDFLRIWGKDYKTPDGTGVRDYLHVVDLARAHVAALEKPIRKNVREFNLGTGRGYSVLEVVKAFEKACGRQVPVYFQARRPGDIARCYANPLRAEVELGWKAEKSLEEMCADTWRWQSANPNGYVPEPAD